ncbi:hypothetical protein [Amycolatopsis sp. cmx-4-68]|uniref:hypothetical protein n=1 Tax=Amycolatopsis sp. cmx-4-68 TaxID=2790938 RepID=UPI00397AFADE
MDVTSAPARRGPAFLVPALAVLAVVLTVAGAFLPLFRSVEPIGSGADDVIRSVMGAWAIRYKFPGHDEISSSSAPVGLPLLVASAILLAAAVLGIRQAATRRPGPAAGRTTLVGAAFLLGAVATVGMLGTRLSDAGRTRAETTLGLGLWLLVAAALAAAVAAVLSLRERAAGRPEWADPDVAYADTTTPPSGVAITVLPPERD